MTVSRIAGLAAGLTLLAFGVAQAQAGAGEHGGRGGAMRQACKADIAKLCPDVQPGGGRVMQCFKAHKDELSDGCKSALAEMRAERRAAKADATPAPTPTPQPQ